MSPSNPHPKTATIPTIDLTPFTQPSSSLPSTAANRYAAGQDLVSALHTLGFVKITGHGVSTEEIQHALSWAKKLFDLPYDEKMKAPHPAGPMPHRGYSGLGLEKVYNAVKVGGDGDENVGKELRKVSDFKESYEIGSEDDDTQQNIWLPDDVLPGFREYMTGLYERLAGVGRVILRAISVGLQLSPEEVEAMMKLDSERHSQLRLLHYPAISRGKVINELFTRLPAHTDWGAFTLLFQDGAGGLELMDPESEEYLGALPEEGVLVLNVGDMLQRVTNDHFISALHRVSVPSPEEVPEEGISARYSIPFFVGPDPKHVVKTMAKFVTVEKPATYEPVKFMDYGAFVSKFQYAGGAN